MSQQGSRRTASESRLRREAMVTIGRQLGAPRLFATAYSTVGSSLYFALGVVASYALGLTPIVFVLAGVLFIITALTYFEGMTLHPERGGSAVMARYAFNEFWSFVAGWAILLDFLILIAISTISIGHYLEAFDLDIGDRVPTVAIAFVVLAAIARYNFMGLAPRGRRAAVLAIVDLALVGLIIIVGLAVVFEPSLIIDSIKLGSVPTWSDFLFGLTVAVIAYTGIEAAANLAPEVRAEPRSLRRTVTAGAVAVLVVFIGMSVVALMALPVEPGIQSAGDTSYGTELGARYLESPVLGVVHAIAGSWVDNVLGYAVAIVASLVLIQAANAGMVGITRTTYTLATHRQLPRGVARLHSRYGTPWIVLLIFSALAFLLVIPHDVELLAGMFAFGALIAFALAHLSVIKLRFSEPDRERVYRVPLNVRVSGRDVPLPAVVGAIASVVAWIVTLIYHDDARWLGSAWMALGIALYSIYRFRSGLGLTQRVEVPAEQLVKEKDVEYGTILVPVFGEALDDDIMSTAGQLAATGRGDEGGAVIEAIYVYEVPMSLPLDARVPADKFEAAQRALARAKQVGEEYENVEVATALVRGRRTGSAICEEARRRGVEAILMGAEPPSPIRGGGVLGGLPGAKPKELGDVTAYVLEKADCRVLITAPPEDATLQPVEQGLDGAQGESESDEAH